MYHFCRWLRICGALTTARCECLNYLISSSNQKEELICAHLFCSSRMIEIQKQLSERAVELLALPEDVPAFILDVG